MMKYFYVEPEVEGDIDEHSDVDRSVHPPIVSRLHYEFDGMPEDALLTSFPCFIVTEEAKQKLLEAGATGVTFDNIKVSTSELFRDLYGSRKLTKKYVWLKVEGQAGREDFGMARDHRLVTSERVLELLTKLGISGAEIEPFDE